jgi:dipeptidyl aminopeptidase/acylaminoacyl peptidase
VAPSGGGAVLELLLPLDDTPAVYLPGSWLPDGSGFLVRTDLGRDFVGLAVFELEERRLQWLATPEWDVEHAALSADGKILVWSVNVNGTSRVHAMELATRAELAVPGLPQGTIVALSVDDSGRRVASIVATGPVPANVVVVDLVDGSTRWITDAAAVVAFDAVEPDPVSYNTFDGRTVPAWLYRPSGDGPIPVVLSIHGGPQSQEKPAYNYGGLYQYLVANGIAVLAPNVRGSAGYGRAYQRLIMRDWGGDDLRDFEAAAIYLRDLDWVDRERIAVFGASYGGFGALSCLSRLPPYWACGVDIFGPANLVTLVRTTVPTWRSSTDELIGNPDTDPEFLMSRSPIRYVNEIRAPLFVIQGANDPRVPQAESDQIVAALRARGVEVRYDVYDDEGHGFTRRANEEKAIGDSAEFLVRHLRG